MSEPLNSNHRVAARLLLAAGAEVNARDADGKTPYRVAEDVEEFAFARLLRDYGGSAS